MKQAAAKYPVDILDQIATIEQDLLNLKLSMLKRFAPTSKKNVKLKGVLKGIDISNDDILAARKSLYDRMEL